MDIDEIALEIGNVLLEKNAKDIEVIEIENKSKIAKRLIVCSVENNQISKKIAHLIKDKFKEKIQCLHTDGIFKGDWIVLDFKDILVHIFTTETRQKYNIEKLWKDSKNSIEIKDIQ